MTASGDPGAPWVVPFVDIRAQARALGEPLHRAMTRVMESGVYILGAEVAGFEAAAARYLGALHAVGVSSGSDALVVALAAAGIQQGDEVVTSPLSFFATAESIARVGAVPRFADIDGATLNLDATHIESAIGSRTRAVLPVHLFGVPADVERFAVLCGQRELWLVEDAAQAFGSRVRGRAAGTCGLLGCFSFFPTKVLGALGDAGLVVTPNDELALRCRRLRGHGAGQHGEHSAIGGNYRLDAIQAAMLSVKLEMLGGWIDARRRCAREYDAAFSGLNGLQIPDRGCIDDWNASIYTVRVLDGRRDALAEYLKGKRIASAVYYRHPLHLQPALSHLGYQRGEFPNAERATDEVLSLPLFPEMTRAERDLVVDTVCRFFR